ncbi:4-hydroxy-tetrahydrodipicolinate synthase [Candidatus Epulonipiscium viviparus]|uniref:4-hydroxy-tetrahydrodipicolinate synthase n=1 Tax=Candidatus Epulonipiscium viviparus TaxID=420336 RepID=UPI0027380CF2|nr:4-hydroxy-tetrahydrodipicolinate synthase [Candidatus Epulopiscium viviparus]
MKTTIFTGSGTAIITPFTDSGVNFSKLEELIEFQVHNKTDAIIVCGTTGETPTMTKAEKEATIKCVVKATNERVPVIAGAGGNDTKAAIEASKYAESVGADAILSVVPYYNKPTQYGLYKHFEAIAKAVKTPIILYNVPGRTVVNLEPATTIKLAEIDNIVAIKECVLSQIAELAYAFQKNNFGIYTGDDPVFLPALAYGATGVVSVMANIIPKDTHMIHEHFIHNQIDVARELQLKTLSLIKALFIESNPAPTKMALNLMGMNVGKCRLPISEMDPKNIEVLTKEMKKYGLLK